MLERGCLYRRGKVWWLKWSCAVTGRVLYRTTGCRDKRAAEQEARRIQRREELRVTGVRVAEGDPLELVKAWATHLRRRDRSPDHVARSAGVVAEFLRDEGVVHAALLTRESAERWLERRRHEAGWSARTFNCYRGYLVAFGRFLAERERMFAANPLAGIEASRRRPTFRRRALADDAGDPRLVAGEGRRLVEAAPWPWNVLWLTVLSCGLRKGEADLLEWRDVGLRKQAIQIRYEVGKGKREDVVPITAEVATALEQLLEQRRLGYEEDPGQVALVQRLAAEGHSVNAIVEQLREQGVARASGGRWWWQHVQAVLTAEEGEVDPGARVFLGLPRRKLAHGLYKHLAAAGIERETNEGRVDMQALRKTFSTQLRRRGVHAFTIQRLMRHTDVRVTTQSYQGWDLLDLRPALEHLGFAARREA